VKEKTLMKGKVLVLAAAIVAASFVLAGCGSSQDPATSDPNYGKDMAPKKTDKGASTAARGAKGGPEQAGD
jgi:outer membrane murein-binding lipoprotein Lpp